MRAEQCGVYHLTAGGSTSWFGFAKAIRNLRYTPNDDAAPILTPVPSSEYPVLAKLPSNSLLDNKKIKLTFGIEQPLWEADLNTCYHELATDCKDG